MKDFFAHLGTVFNKTTCNIETNTIILRLIIRMHIILEDTNAIKVMKTRQNRHTMLTDVLFGNKVFFFIT